jgi:hypothetical protein
MLSIKVKMKRGGFMMLEATGRCYRTTDGAGAPYQEVDDLQLYWPRKKRDKKSYPVKETLVSDWSQVEEEFWDADSQQAENNAIDAHVYSQFDH